MNAAMANDSSKKPGFIGENPNWILTALAAFAIVAAVLVAIFFIFQ